MHGNVSHRLCGIPSVDSNVCFCVDVRDGECGRGRSCRCSGQLYVARHEVHWGAWRPSLACRQTYINYYTRPTLSYNMAN